jgi:hypothetical protein
MDTRSLQLETNQLGVFVEQGSSYLVTLRLKGQCGSAKGRFETPGA